MNPETLTQPTALQRVVLVANQKGGVGKTSIVTALAGLIARPDRRVLVVDADPQGNATASDLGVEGDRGRSLMLSLQYGEPLQVQTDVRPGLDLVAGGPLLAQVGALTTTAAQTGLDVVANLRTALAEVCARGNYTVVLIDSGPGDAPLLDALLRTTRYLVVPTKDDDASLSGMELLALRYLRARQEGAPVELLGVVLFDANPRATARNAQVLSDIDDVLAGSGATSFPTMIRSDRAAALDLRAAHLTPAELVAASAAQNKSRLARLRGGKHRADRKPESTDNGEPRLWSRDPSALASDYQALARELLTRIATAEAGARA
ncbi:ParA family protein (plasmid) [Pseudonocardia bannensis]|uniref:ParA family protein n=1 Tax=Pseudonocardia bannensis TaxID=630973 RepID=A0A848DS33_9PSEU|nr:ParA family protein [Pseudonocardia bannensis]NMH95662.1 ParA family protein [Pseudonocardia bannensis]